MSNFLRSVIIALLWAALVPVSRAGAENGGGGAIVFVVGDGVRRDIMVYEPGSGALTLLAGEKGVMETQPVLGAAGETAWVRRVGPVWQLLKNGVVISSGPLHLSPAFRPDGALAAAVSGDEETNIYIFNGEAPSLLVKGEGLAISPAFSPDGRHLAYVSDLTGQGQIYVAEADGANARLLLPSPALNTDPAWSPDGSFIVFVSNETDIFVVQPNGSGLKSLTRNQGVNRRPSFSPDGRKIVFSSDRSGQFRLYTMNADGSEQNILLPELNEPQHAPHWGPAAPPLDIISSIEADTTQKDMPQKD